MKFEIILGGLLAVSMYINYRLAFLNGRKNAENGFLKRSIENEVNVKKTYELAVDRMEKRVENFEKRLSGRDIAIISDAELNRLWTQPTADTELPTHPESDQKSETK